MTLSKEQINRIDQYLKLKGIKYWDLRIEMIDHLVTDMEHHAFSNDFDAEFKEALKRVGWDKNLKDENTKGWKTVGNMYGKKYAIEFLAYFKSFKNILILTLFCYLYISSSQRLSFSGFKKVSLVIFYLPIIYFLVMSLINWKKGFKKSINLDYGTSYLFSAMMILNIFPVIFENSSEETITIMWLIMLPIYLIASYSGYKVYKESLKKVTQLKTLLE